ncbi:hypothetical protein A3G98_02100 [Candidatus Nomurabacteria bacterium RIFCSPLOWO2_12_FULL_37_8]|uniref:Methyltransferase type 11 domain-containing protein n=1 Tax=Candidatus Nomurabacteria bacterium RIFCSPLOWO2_12_FULL_37_8 TaxID=1801793 RepID=A0A1F6Y749_9BACT|nr:MAG: hypothetical protein A3G98_02100 [Candidatus Nomurabacteria bacterium RIFCSPLOWO2_12_FULL_37_8]
MEIKNLKVLEIGSGNGIFLDFLRKKGVNAVGLDVRSGGYGSPQVAARIEQIPLKSDEFDLVLSLGNVFDQMVYDQDHDLMIREIYRVLKPKGLYLGYGLAKIKASPIEGFTELIKPGEDNIFRHLYQKS